MLDTSKDLEQVNYYNMKNKKETYKVFVGSFNSGMCIAFESIWRSSGIRKFKQLKKSGYPRVQLIAPDNAILAWKV